MANPEFTKRRPDYRLVATRHGDKARTTLGSAWINPDGFISIKLGPYVTITPDVAVYLSLVPNRDLEEPEQ